MNALDQNKYEEEFDVMGISVTFIIEKVGDTVVCSIKSPIGNKQETWHKETIIQKLEAVLKWIKD